MKVHMSLSSGLCAKEQFPTYWHLRPFWAWMQSCGWVNESLLSLTGLCHSVGQFKAFQDLQPLIFSPPQQMLTSYCCGKFRMDGSGLTDTHFLLALDITRRTRLSFVQL